MANEHEKLIEAMGAERMTRLKGALRLDIGDVTVAYAHEATKGVRLHVQARELPASLTRGLEFKPMKKAELSVLVEDERQAKRLRPILERVARDRAKAKA